MTREDQIREASKSIHACEVRCVIAFEQGAKWADKNPVKIKDETSPFDLCNCGHERQHHIYHTGGCRPGFICQEKCTEFNLKSE